ncbi:MAG: NAD(P)/FAD-dependent oxidoreductase [Clostridia bacterium]|nr:NAD(P)/FAD-dependent oxidoreductase [Clostridia bacterium]
MKVTVIGGGPAGLMAASSASLMGADVVLLEHQSYLLRKLGITGKGRCNITNATDMSEFIGNIPVNGKFMHSAFYAFTNEDMIELLEKYGVETKVERGGRVFPVSDKAKSVVDALKQYAKDSGIKVVYDGAVSVSKTENGFNTKLKSGKVITSDKVIIATGGMSYPQTGSTGDGYRFAKDLGHNIVTPKPSLVPLTTKGNLPQKLMGLSLKNISIKITDENNKKVYEDFGEMIFTHYGVSGPVILSASSHLRDFGERKYTLSIDLKPALDEIALDKRILRDFEKEINRDFINALDALLPQKLIPVIVDLSNISPRKKVRDITKAERMSLVSVIKNLTLEITGTRPIAEAIITSGGINVKEINPKTMESKIIDGLYFAGEIIDVDAYTGGFNLQIAYSTGYLAGTSAGKDY